MKEAPLLLTFPSSSVLEGKQREQRATRYLCSGLRAWMAVAWRGLSTLWFGDLQPGTPSFLTFLGSSPLSQGWGRDREKLLWPRLPERVYRPSRMLGVRAQSRGHT